LGEENALFAVNVSIASEVDELLRCLFYEKRMGLGLLYVGGGA